MNSEANNMLEPAVAHIERGFFLVPLKDKAPFEKEWQNTPVRDIEAAYEYWGAIPDLNMGLLLGNATGIGCLDFDYDEENIHQLIKQMVPDSPVSKVGKKGCTLFFRIQLGMKSKSWKSPQGDTILDFLANGRQTVLPPSIHPETKKPYVWCGKSLLELESLEELPELKPEHLLAIDAFFKEKYGKSEPLPNDSHSHALIISALSYIPAHDYNTWINIGMVLKNALGESGFDLWDQWSKQSDKSTSRKFLR